MSLLTKGGISKLSELNIDVNKNWGGYGITNFGGLPGMAIGHIIQHDGLVLVTLAPGAANQVLTSQGPAHPVTWAPGGCYLERYFPVSIDLEHNEAVRAVAQAIAQECAPSTDLVHVIGDVPVQGVKLLQPAIESELATATKTPAHSSAESDDIDTECALEYPVGGCVSDDGGVQTDETVDINDPGGNDVALLPPAPLQVGDACYFGLGRIWHQLWTLIGQAGGGNYALAHEYYRNDASWQLLPNLVDNTNEWQASGLKNVHWTDPGDWMLLNIMGYNLYWIRARVTTAITYTQQPLATQGWCEVIV